MVKVSDKIILKDNIIMNQVLLRELWGKAWLRSLTGARSWSRSWSRSKLWARTKSKSRTKTGALSRSRARSGTGVW